jgi:hypothetical protein
MKMKTIKISMIAIFCALASFTGVRAQQLVTQNAPNNFAARGQMAFQRKSQRPSAATIRERLLQRGTSASASLDAPTRAGGSVPCNAPTGTRFNLEPRVNATSQSAASADFLLNGVGIDNDLVVQTASDSRGLSQSNSGYYIHRSTTPDCSVQFEGGLPPFQFQGDTFIGTNAQGGGPLVVADSARNAFFAADGRTGNNSAGIGLFRAAAADLLNPAKCPDGTHTVAQATSCWMQTPPAFLDSLPVFDEAGEPFLAVDERATGSGAGAGDVYVLYGNGPTPLSIVACTNSLNCGAAALIPVPANTNNLPYGGVDVHVTPTGLITVSFGLLPRDGRQKGESLFFTTCTPGGAPKPPTCAQPTVVAKVTNEILSSFPGVPLENLNGFPLEITTPRHATRPGPGNDFTTFLVYDDCVAPLTSQGGNPLCAGGEVNLTISSDSGKTWSKPISVDTKVGHHFFGNVATDGSTGTVSIVYLSTEGDPNFHQSRVMLNQIAPGSTKLGPQQRITSVLDATDIVAGAADSAFLVDLGLGVVSRGTGSAGHSRLYTSFNSSLDKGLYEKEPLPDLNNDINLQTF